jgi:RHS repeat-associated protein
VQFNGGLLPSRETRKLAGYYTYDLVGNLLSKTDRKGNTIQYLYDALYRLTQKTYPDTTNVEYVYDLANKVLQVSDPTGTYGFAGACPERSRRDNMGRLISTTTQYAFLPGPTYTNNYTYDAASNRTSLTAPDGSITTYGYDTLNRLNGLANSWAGSFGFSYDALSRRTQLTRPNGVNTNYSYDSLSHLLSVLHQAGVNTLDGASYTYDPAGNRTAKTNYLNGTTSNYTYDQLYELTQVTQGASTTESYSYDPVGNRLSSSGVPNYSYNVSNELTSNSTGSYTYDANGNTLTDASGKSYTWDFENRLTQAMVPGSGTVTFKYDPFGRRIYKSSSLATSIYSYDGDNLVEEANAAGALAASYSQTQNIDDPLAALRSGATSYYEADGPGSITSLSSAAGSVANTYSYDAFGKLTASTGSVVNPVQYTGRETDLETGLYYYRARYYDSTTGRFLNEDPTSFQGGINFYPYVANDPVDRTDPTGFDSDSQFCRRLQEKIDNVKQNIQRRLGQLDENPDNLPETCPGDKAKPSLSRSGHRMLINMDKALLAALEATYAARCKDGPPPPPIPIPVQTPEQQQRTVKALSWGTAAAGGTYLILEYGWVLVF